MLSQFGAVVLQKGCRSILKGSKEQVFVQWEVTANNREGTYFALSSNGILSTLQTVPQYSMSRGKF